MRTFFLALAAMPLCIAGAADDLRQPVSMPAPMQAHLRANMRDHLQAVAQIQSALAAGQYDRAADIAEQRLGMTSLEAHGARHMAGMMPEGMQAVGTAMHHTASRFALIAQEGSVSGDLPRVLGALADVTQHCVACHANFRLADAP
jgi:hypothetical protein